MKKDKIEIGLPDIMDFLNLARKFSRQIEILSKVNIPDNLIEITKNAVKNVEESARQYANE